MNIIYEVEKQNLRLISFNPDKVYQLDELKFYISKNYKNITPFLHIKDSRGNQDIIRLTQIESDKNYNIFSVALSNSIAVKEGSSMISVLVLNTDTITTSNVQSLFLDYENYHIGYQLNLIEHLSKHLVATYKRIEQMTEMNINIYESIEEVMNK